MEDVPPEIADVLQADFHSFSWIKVDVDSQKNKKIIYYSI